MGETSRSQRSLIDRVLAWQIRDPLKHPAEQRQRQPRMRLRQSDLEGGVVAVVESFELARRSAEQIAWEGRRQMAAACEKE